MLKTFEKEEELPNLPLPDLDSTVSLYLDSVKALSIGDDAFTTTAELVKDPKLNLLHDELVRRSQEKKNWVRLSYYFFSIVLIIISSIFLGKIFLLNDGAKRNRLLYLKIMYTQVIKILCLHKIW